MYIHALSSMWCGRSTIAYIAWPPFTKLFFSSNLQLVPFSAWVSRAVPLCVHLEFVFPFLLTVSKSPLIPASHSSADWQISAACSSSRYLCIIWCYSVESSGDVWVVQLFTDLCIFTPTYCHIINATSVPEVCMCPYIAHYIVYSMLFSWNRNFLANSCVNAGAVIV